MARTPRTGTALRVSALGALATLALLAAPAPDAPVADAAMRGDGASVEALLQRGADVNAAQGDGMTALHWAARNGDVQIAEMLLYAGARTESVTRVGEYTPLLVAAKAGRGEVVPTLLDGGAAPMARTSTGVTAMHFAAANGLTGAMETLAAAGAEIDAREFASEQTPLMFAAANGRTDAVRFLIDGGADVHATSRVVDVPKLDEEDGEFRRLREERVAALRRIDEETEKVGQAQEAEEAAEGEAEAEGDEAEEETPAAEEDEAEEDEAEDEDEAEEDEAEEDEEAAEEEEEDDEPEPVVEGLKNYSYAELVGKQGGLTALHHAARNGHAAAVRELLSAGAEIDRQTLGDESTPLLLASINGYYDLGKELVEAGADPNIASHAGATPLYTAINVEWAPRSLYPQPNAHEQQVLSLYDYMTVLLDAGADPDARLSKHLWYMSYNFDLLGVNTAGATAFWRAAYAQDVEAMQLLLEHGADPSITTYKMPERRRFRRYREGDDEDKSGLPKVPVGGPHVAPIHAASGVGFGEGYAANAHRGYPDGWMAAIRFLVEEVGADVNARDADGYTPLHHAASRGDVEMIRYLVEQGADVTAVARNGRTTVDMANGPVQRVQPWPEAVELLESLGGVNNHNCVSC